MIRFLTTINGKTIALLGFGRSNRAVADFLVSEGRAARVYTSDKLPPEVKAHYAPLGFCFFEGDFPAVFTEEVLVRSPVIRPDAPPIVRAVKSGATLTDEIALFLARTRATVIGVTGSDGKTTTANLVARLLAGAGHRVFLGGNNGTPLLPRAGEMRAGDLAVLELSSFQLITQQISPAVAIVTNVTPNHLNWHVDMAEYVAAKRRIYDPMTRLVVNAQNDVTREMGKGHEGAVFFTRDGAMAPSLNGACLYPDGNDLVLAGEGELRRYPCLDAYRLKGAHNLENLLAAVGAVAPFIDGDVPRRSLADFGGVAHRMQYVDTVAGVTYYNSSIDTSPSRVVAALSVFDRPPVVIAGGRGKGVSFLPMVEVLIKKARAVALYGEAAGEIAALIGDRVPTTVCDRFEAAFAAAAAAARSGDTVLLSPGATAFDQFADFEARGEAFCRLVANLKGS